MSRRILENDSLSFRPPWDWHQLLSIWGRFTAIISKWSLGCRRLQSYQMAIASAYILPYSKIYIHANNPQEIKFEAPFHWLQIRQWAEWHGLPYESPNSPCRHWESVITEWRKHCNLELSMVHNEMYDSNEKDVTCYNTPCSYIPQLVKHLLIMWKLLLACC